jgi:uncharacterized integral membrane protein
MPLTARSQQEENNLISDQATSDSLIVFATCKNQTYNFHTVSSLGLIFFMILLIFAIKSTASSYIVGLFVYLFRFLQ